MHVGRPGSSPRFAEGNHPNDRLGPSAGFSFVLTHRKRKC